MPSKIYPFIKYLIGWPLSAVALIFVIKIFLTNKDALYEIKNINFLLLFAGILVYIIYFFMRAYLWKTLLKDKISKVSFKQNAFFWSMSELKRYIPGSVWSFAARTTSFENENLSKREIVKFLAKEAVILCLCSLILSFFYLDFLLKNGLLNNLFLSLVAILVLIFIFGDKALSVFNYSKIYRLFSIFLPNYTYFENFKILLLGLATFFTFGLGTYFTFASIFYTDINYALILTSLFIFAFFIGYISLITPMGLGVRETVTTFGLVTFIGSTAGALTSIYTRVIFIISELASILIIVVWSNIKNNKLKKIEQFVVDHKYEITLAAFIFLYVLYYTFASILRYDNFYTGRFDLGNMDQTVWNTAHGRIFQLTDPDGTNTISRLSVHADFILIILAPLYFVWSNPQTLLILQTFVLAFGALGIYLISQEVLKNKNVSLALSSAYLLNPAVGFTNLYDFHPITLATTFLLFTFYFFLKKNYIGFFIFAIAAGLTKEEEWAIVGLFGIFIAGRSYLKNKNKPNWRLIIFGLLIFIAGVFSSYLLIAKIIPFVKGADHFALAYYSDFGNSSSEIIKNIFLNPIKTLSTLFGKHQIEYLTQLFGPLGFMSILSPVYLIFAIPDLLISLLSNNVQLHQIYYQYSAPITPFIFISAIYGIKKIVEKFKVIDFEKISVYIIFASLYFAYTTGPMPATLQPNTDMFTKQLVSSKTINNFLIKLPKKYSIAATNNLGSHLSRREKIYTIPIGLDKADVIAILIDHGFSSQSTLQQMQMINHFKQNKNYVLEFSDKDFYVFAKKNLNFHLKM